MASPVREPLLPLGNCVFPSSHLFSIDELPHLLLGYLRIVAWNVTSLIVVALDLVSWLEGKVIMMDMVHELEGYVVVSGLVHEPEECVVVLDLVHVPEEHVVVLDLVPELEEQVVGPGLVPQLGEGCWFLLCMLCSLLPLLCLRDWLWRDRCCSFCRFTHCRQFQCRWSFICHCSFCIHWLSSAPVRLIQYV